MGNTVKWLIAWIVIFIGTIVIAEVALDVIVSNSVSSDAEIQELRGIQGANYARQRVKVRRAKKSGKTEVAKSIEQIVEEQKPQYVAINDALEKQKELYDAQKAKNYDASARTVAELNEKIPLAKQALTVLAKLLEQEVVAIRAMDNDEASIYVAKATYKSWEAAVRTLKPEALTFEELDERRKVILTEGSGAIATSRQVMQGVKPNELEPDDKQELDKEVVTKGKAVVDNLSNMLKSVPQNIFGALVAIDFIDKALKRYGSGTGGMLEMMDDMQFGQGFFAKSRMSDFERKIDSITGGVSLYLKQIKPFISTVGSRIGRDDVVGIENTPIIRFSDPKGRYVIAEDNDDYRLSVDTMGMRRDNANKEDIIFMYCYEFSEAGSKKFAAKMLNGTRYIYTLARLKPGAVKILPGATSYQREDFSEIARVQEGSKNIDTIKVKSDEASMVEIIKYLIPFDPAHPLLHYLQPGARNYVIRNDSKKK